MRVHANIVRSWDMARGIAAGMCLSALIAGCTELKTDLAEPTSEALNVHAEGWTDPGSPNFHGIAIKDAGWDMLTCKSCHGPTYSGGTSEVSCRTCHDQPAGPENCATCHGSTNPAPPEDLEGNITFSARGVGAHQKHLVAGTYSDVLICSSCHVVPGQVYEPGHVDTPLPAEVPIPTSLARTETNEPGATYYTSSLPTFTPQPMWAAESLTCASTYCHGNFKNGNDTNTPLWVGAPGTQAACGTCHGDPTAGTPAARAQPKSAARGGTHPSVTGCGCHSDVVDGNLNIINKHKHINGKLNVSGGEYNF
jgi:predicted CxxxxCH...CXXCH cytochrome family protein